MENTDILEKYIYRLYEIQEERRNLITEADLRVAAESVGLSEQEIDELELSSAKQLSRAKSYTRTEHWEEAEKELKKAMQLNSMRPEYVFALAELYWKWYRKTGRKKQLHDACSYAQGVIALSPSHKAAEHLLLAIEERKKKNRTQKRIYYSLSAILTPLLILFLFLLVKEIILSNIPTGLEGRKYEVPIEIVPDKQLEGLTMNFSKGQVIHPDYISASNFDFTFNSSINANKFELVELGFRASFRNRNDEEVADAFYWYWYEGQMSLRPHDWYYFRENQAWSSGYFNNKPDEIKYVKMEIQGVKRYSGATVYPESEAIDVNWISAKPNGLDLAILQRSHTVGVLNETDRKTEQKLLLEIKNTGTQPCKEIILNLDWFHKGGEKIRSELFTVIELGEKTLEPNDKLVYLVNKQFSGEPWKYPNPFSTFRVGVKSIH